METQEPKKDTRFKKGCKPGPGRPTGSVGLFNAIRRELLKRTKTSPKGQNVQLRDQAAKAYVDAMLKGDIKHLIDFLDRDEGKPSQPIALTGTLELESMTPQEAVARQAAVLERASLVRPRLEVSTPKAGPNGNGNGRGHR